MDIYSDRKAVGELNSIYAEAVYGKPKSAGQELANREKRDDAACCCDEEHNTDD